MGFLSDNVKTFQRDKFNFSKRDSSVKVFLSTELFSGEEVVKLESDATIKSNEEWLETWVSNNF